MPSQQVTLLETHLCWIEKDWFTVFITIFTIRIYTVGCVHAVGQVGKVGASCTTG